jgi:hypothetical protein
MIQMGDDKRIMSDLSWIVTVGLGENISRSSLLQSKQADHSLGDHMKIAYIEQEDV